MKKTLSTIFGLAALSLVTITTSCSSDNNNDAPTVPGSTFVVNRDNLQGEINDGEVILESGTYKLTGKLVVKSTAKLTIKPGVIIEATTLDPNKIESIRYIAISQGGKIDVQGTAANPVVMTAVNHKPGAWGGLVICGKAPINKGATASAEVSDLPYGGTDVNDNSGSIKYLRIEYPGYAYNSDKEFNGISFFGVGKGTSVDYVQIFESSDDGFEWFGGTVNATHLVVSNKDAANVGDDLFDWTEGWNGTGEFFYGIRTNAGNRGVEADNNSNNHLASPISFPTIKNLTLVGFGSADTSAESQAFKLRVGTKGKFDNVVLKGWKTGFDVQHDETVSYVGVDLLATNVKFEDVAAKSKGSSTAGVTVDVTKVFTESTTANGAGNGSGVPTWAAGWTKGL
ncbi:hypothetical protein B0A67_09700 [Flavobacterium aquidurense]|uniref:hypothetical protein n=1 Tax=Flavobacterium aquidurense TaxID=362413 RepID=UPI000923BCD4|nr:hypothetical protein [Flavobacterium aquidurense]OXA71873.1 hypothetical protein B0A67_09700 [Flavobacterium aquidurense]SHH53769.1 hypothetical protein SAMN05444481_11932 [Flavobacterium frigidimaris]